MERPSTGERWAFGRPHQPFITPQKRWWSGVASMTVAFLLVGGIALADGIQGDIDALSTSAPAANGLDASQAAGATSTYAYSAFIKETGNATDDVFASSGDTVSATVAITQNDLGWTASVDTQFTGTDTFTAYDQNRAGSLSVTVPAGATVGTVNHIKVEIAATASNGQGLSPTNVILNYNITVGSGGGGGGGTPPNQAPIVDAGGPYAGGEGGGIPLDGASATDSDGTISTTTWEIVSDAAVAPGECTLSNTSSLTASISCTDNGTATVRLTATDDDGASTSDDATVNVSNVAPVASGGSFTVNPFTGVANAGFAFSDDGTADTHTATFTWNGADNSGSVTETNGAGTAAYSRTLTPGCYTLTVTGKVTDDDLADSNIVTLANGVQFPVYNIGFLPPIKDGERNIAKYGNVVPVKVSITNPCANNAPVTANLFVSYYKGTGDPVDSTPVLTGESVATPDGTSGQMRLADGFYIFNFTTKPLTCNTDYTIRIWLNAIGGTGTQLLDAVLSLKK
jgi:hypothetical protein